MAPKPTTRRSATYVMRDWVRGRPTEDATRNACAQMLDRHRADLHLIPTLAASYRAYEASVGAEERRVRLWFTEFTDAYYRRSPMLAHSNPRKGHVPLTSQTYPIWSWKMLAVARLIDAEYEGLRQDQLKRLLRRNLRDTDSNGSPGALSKLHAFGLIARLADPTPPFVV